MKTIISETSSQITVKKSKFIASIAHVESIEEADKFIKDICKKYNNARHNCFAYVLYNDNYTKSSDDGEPSGTAGKPMLEILTKNEYTNIVGVVTRYFGGILLGTGGLVRAYSDALLEALNAAMTKELKEYIRVEVIVDSAISNKVYTICGKQNCIIENTTYNEKENILINVPIDKINNVCDQITNETNGNVGLKKVENILI